MKKFLVAAFIAASAMTSCAPGGTETTTVDSMQKVAGRVDTIKAVNHTYTPERDSSEVHKRVDSVKKN